MRETTGIARTGEILRISNLAVEASTRQRGAFDIVKGVDLRLERGEVLGLVGESGAGKSTIGLAALGYLKPGCRLRGGEVVFDGVSLTSMPERERRALRGVRIAYVAQSAAASFNPAKRLMDQIVEAAAERGGMARALAETKAVALFHSLQLPDPDGFGAKFPHQVSGGQLQRAMTAMAMICDPDLIVFDEPTTALDVTTQVEVLLAIRQAIRERGVAALYISHDLAVVAQIADRVMVLRHGAAVEEASVADVLSAPKHPYTRTLWAVRNLPEHQHPSRGPLLSVAGVSASYDRYEVLKDVGFGIDRGQTVALVGESGSGKSTLGRIVAGLMRPTGGTIRLGDETLPATVSERTRETLRRVQIIYQSADTALNPRQSVRKILGRPLSFFRGLRGRAREARLAELMQMVELDASYLDRMPSQLSGGQRQRVAIARALAAEPELIICDEITSALDQVVQAGILRMLDGLQERLGVSFLFITHDLEIVKAIADRVLVLKAGRIADEGPKAEVIDPPRHDYTRLLLDSVPEMTPGWLDAVAARRPALGARAS